MIRPVGRTWVSKPKSWTLAVSTLAPKLMPAETRGRRLRSGAGAPSPLGQVPRLKGQASQHAGPSPVRCIPGHEAGGQEYPLGGLLSSQGQR